MKLHSISDKYRLQYVQDYRFPRFLMNLNENTHTCTCQRSKLEIDIRGKIEDFFIDTIYFLPEEININENKFPTEIYVGNVYIFSPKLLSE